MTAHALRDWCQLSKRPGQCSSSRAHRDRNPFVESFHSRVRDELLDVEEFCSLAEARVVIGDRREDYHLRRPHTPRSECSPRPPSPPNAPPAPPTARRHDPR
jgi:hypothetical protein